MASLTRSEVCLYPDPGRRVAKPYLPSDHGLIGGKTRVQLVLDRILNLSPGEVEGTLRDVRAGFADRHHDLDGILEQGFASVIHAVPDPASLPDQMRHLIGAYFMHEYSLEGAALTNPSIVAAPDQSGSADGSLRVIVSVRAVGEGHISSIEFRTGQIGPHGQIALDAPLPPVTGARRAPRFDKALFTAKLDEMGAAADPASRTLEALGDYFTLAELESVSAAIEPREGSSNAGQHTVQLMHWLASSNYDLTFPDHSDLSQRVLFPNAPSESHGMEDARFVRFTQSDGEVVYYATYTAFDGFGILPQLIETTDFSTFRIATLGGPAARNKGIALFPRRIDGRYAALARFDGESNYLMVSDDVHSWGETALIQTPARPWELMQIGNAGSPIETEAGWLVVTHGVGPMRQYALGALLLDIEDPRRVIGHLPEPLLVPTEVERDGYVPNVVYSCGSLVHNDHLVVAYGASDTTTGFATVPLPDLLAGFARR